MEFHQVVPCHIRIRALAGKTEQVTLTRVRDHPEINSDIRKQWVRGLCKVVESVKNYQKIIPLNFVLGLNGSIEHVDSYLSEKSVLSSDTGYLTAYASRYRIPPETIEDLDNKEKVRRAVLFALGGLIYEIHSGQEPFESLDHNEVQRRYSNAEFPNVITLEQRALILSCWSTEFAIGLRKSLAQRPSPNIFHKLTSSTGSYIKAHPYLFGMQMAGAAVGATALATPLILGAVGFGALGPVAGSSAAAWQASIGLVEAGSLFAWCQGAVMGGAAATGLGAIVGTGAGVTGIAASATAAGVWKGMSLTEREELVKLFHKVCRRAVAPKTSSHML